MTNETLVAMSKKELRQLPALSHEQLLVLQKHRREVMRVCGSLQTGDGLPCELPPRVGWTVCRKHGERAPQTAAKAERLLAVARMPAIEWILLEIERAGEERCDTCGYPDQSLKERKHTASLTFRLLDRTGFGPHSKVDFNINRSDQPEIPIDNWEDSERSELSGLVQQIRLLKDRVARRMAVDAGRQVIEGTVVKQLTPAVNDVTVAPGGGEEGER